VVWLLWPRPAYPQQLLGYGVPCTAAQVASCTPSPALRTLFGFNVNTTASGWVFLLDAATVPAPGTVTVVKPYQVAANQTLGVSWIPDAQFMTSGITIACSSTPPPTYTPSATCYIGIDAR
jgi:hypothetical protein